MNKGYDPLAWHQYLEAPDDLPDGSAGRPVLGRRAFVQGSLATFLAGSVAPALCRESSLPMGFASVSAELDEAFDGIRVPPDYDVQVLLAWGDPVVAGAPAWRPDAGNDWREQLLQAGQNHDGMHFFPFAERPNEHGLLVINHEYINPTLHPEGFSIREDEQGRRYRPKSQVRKEQAAHGVSIVEIERRDGAWQRVAESRYNRRLSGLTPMALTGPAAGHPSLRTPEDPKGRRVIGTLNNCAMGVTPWGTYLVCEENWKHYFVNRDTDDYRNRPSHHRYGVTQGEHSHYYAWESVDERYNATPSDDGKPDFVNEPHRFGWVVEVDPFAPDSTPKKRTAMGRLIRECATLSLAPDGRMAFYSGDDTVGEYVYKFVPEARWQSKKDQETDDILDNGTLYVARYNDDGSGEWLPLVHGRGGLTEENGFPDQASVLINARSAADFLGATSMDRPEWVAVHPESREVYVSLTKNPERGTDKHPLNAANPRRQNRYGHILRWRENNGDPGATSFRWDIFTLAGLPSDSKGPEHLHGTVNGDLFACPDGLVFDPQGRLWIATDFDDEEAIYRAMGTNQLLCADPVSREVRRFLVGPAGCEVTGACFSPDNTTLWVNIQHPGGSFPAGDGKTRPRSATLVVRRGDGKPVGS
jgi:secreted PhoX family phosphatase